MTSWQSSASSSRRAWRTSARHSEALDRVARRARANRRTCPAGGDRGRARGRARRRVRRRRPARRGAAGTPAGDCSRRTRRSSRGECRRRSRAQHPAGAGRHRRRRQQGLARGGGGAPPHGDGVPRRAVRPWCRGCPRLERRRQDLRDRGPREFGLVDLRDATTGESIRSFHGHDVDLNGVAFSPDGRMLATTGDDGALHMEPASGEQLLEHVDGAYRPGSDDPLPVRAPAFSPDGSLVVAGFHGRRPGHDVASGKVVHEVSGADTATTAVSPDGRSLSDRLLQRQRGRPCRGHRVRRRKGALGPSRRVVDLAAGVGSRRSLDRHGRERDDRAVVGTPGAATSGSPVRAIPRWSAASTGHRMAIGSPPRATTGTAIVWELTEGGLRTVLELSTQPRKACPASPSRPTAHG